MATRPFELGFCIGMFTHTVSSQRPARLAKPSLVARLDSGSETMKQSGNISDRLPLPQNNEIKRTTTTQQLTCIHLDQARVVDLLPKRFPGARVADMIPRMCVYQLLDESPPTTIGLNTIAS